MTKLPGRTGNPEGNTRQGKVGLKNVNFFFTKTSSEMFFFFGNLSTWDGSLWI